MQQVFARDERFFENPNDFIPERYEGKGTFKLFRPFGIGRRSCIGQVLARKEIYTLLKQVIFPIYNVCFTWRVIWVIKVSAVYTNFGITLKYQTGNHSVK